MGNWSDLKASIAKVIRDNGNQEITGSILQSALNSIISNLGENYNFVGIATTSTNPGTPDGNVFYIAGEGTYANFSGLSVGMGELAVLKWNGTWSKQTLKVGLPPNELNISYLFPTSGEGGTNRYTLARAIAQVPADNRSIQGLKITFVNDETGKPETWVYNGGTFTTVTNWALSNDSEKLKDIEKDTSLLTEQVEKLNNIVLSELTPYEEGPGFIKVDGTISTQFGGKHYKYNVSDVSTILISGRIGVDPNAEWAVYQKRNAEEVVKTQQSTLQEYNNYAVDVSDSDEIWINSQSKSANYEAFIVSDEANPSLVKRVSELEPLKEEIQIINSRIGNLNLATDWNGGTEDKKYFYNSNGIIVNLSGNSSASRFGTSKVNVKKYIGRELIIDTYCADTAYNLFVTLSGSVIEKWQQGIDSPAVKKIVPDNTEYLLLSNNFADKDGIERKPNPTVLSTYTPAEETVFARLQKLENTSLTIQDDESDNILSITDKDGNILAYWDKDGNFVAKGIDKGGTPTTENHWKDKKWYAYGTSITSVQQGQYVQQLAELSGMIATNKGIPGGGITNLGGNATGQVKSAIMTLDDGKAEADLITLEVGPNEGGEIGTKFDTGDETFCGCLNQCIRYLQENTNAQIVIMTSVSKTTEPEEEYYDRLAIIKDVCAINRVYHIAGNCGLGWARIKGDDKKYTSDNIHQTALGGYILAEYMWSIIKDIPTWKISI